MMKSKKSAIILCSGGLDSVVTAFYVNKQLEYQKITILFFNYGQKSLEQERKCSSLCANHIGAEFIEIKLDWLDKISNSLINKDGKVKKLNRKDLKDTCKESQKFYVPCRNTLFLTYALALADSNYRKNKEDCDIFVGFKCEGKENYPDTTIVFVKTMNNLSSVSCEGKFQIRAPLIKKDKEDVIKLGEKLEVNFKDTFSCYVPINNHHCGYCLACKLRQEGFYWANLKDPTVYSRK